MGSWLTYGLGTENQNLPGFIAMCPGGYPIYQSQNWQSGFLPGIFDPAFPRDLVLYLLGARSLLAIGLWLSTFGLGLWALRRERLVWAAVLLVVAAAGVLWLVIQPLYLYPRFFIFLIPGCAFVLAAAIKRWKVLAPVVVLGAVAAAVSQVPDYTTDPLALRQAAAVVAEADASGKHVCLIHSDEQVLGAYAPSGFTVVTSADQLKSCDMVVVVSWGIDIPLRDEAARDFPRRTSLPAVYPTIVLER